MNTIQKFSICCLLLAVARSDARTLREHEINDEVIKTVLDDELKIKTVRAQEQKLDQTFDFSKINSSTERPMVNIDMVYDQIDALERHLAGVSAQVHALKTQVREARQVAQEKYDAEQKQTQSLLAQLQETREKLNQTQQFLAAADQRQHQLEAQVVQLTQAEKAKEAEGSVAADVTAVGDDVKALERIS